MFRHHQQPLVYLSVFIMVSFQKMTMVQPFFLRDLISHSSRMARRYQVSSSLLSTFATPTTTTRTARTIQKYTIRTYGASSSSSYHNIHRNVPFLIRGGGSDTIIRRRQHQQPTTKLYSSTSTTTTTTTTTDDDNDDNTTSIITTSSSQFQDFLHSHDNVILSYITDIEGDKAYLDRYVENSKILTFRPAEDDHQEREEDLPYIFPYDQYIDFTDNNSVLVFGGDLWDKGGFDLYVARQILDLKRRYPHRVFWVLGNRDINKLRMMEELGLPSTLYDVKVPYHPGLTWFRGSGRVGDPEGTLPPMEPGRRLEWMLKQTMGSPDAMEHRRQELAWEATLKHNTTADNIDKISVSDNEVVRSYQKSCHPNGELGLFLAQGLLAARIGPALFVHGSLPLTSHVMEKAKEESRNIWDDLTFAMPWINKDESAAIDYGVKTIDDWIEALNQFCHGNIVKWKKDIAKREQQEEARKEKLNDSTYDDYNKERSKALIWAYQAGYGNSPPYSDLIQYGMGMTPDGKKNPTVVYNSFTPEGMPNSFLPPDQRDEVEEAQTVESDVASCTRDFFERSSIQLILTGHKPQGDMPSPIRVDQSSWVICADTSYSGDTIWWHENRQQQQ